MGCNPGSERRLSSGTLFRLARANRREEEHMKHGRLKRKACVLASWAVILALASVLCAQNTGQQPSTAQQDILDLQNARDYFTKGQLDDAKKICDRLATKSGPVATDALDLLNQIQVRRASEQVVNQVEEDARHGECQQAAALLQGIHQRDPSHPGLSIIDDAVQRCKSAAPVAAPTPPALQQGITLFNNGEYEKALRSFKSQRSANPPLLQLQEWIDKATRALEAERRETPAKPAAVARPKSQEKDRASQEAVLADAIHEFYAGNLPHAEQELEQYVAEPGTHQALAYFYQGAIACTNYFLAGAKDDQQESQARDFFSKARQADGGFTPPGDFVSPKIMKVYQETAAGS